jgi:D-serine deaminase-like pyridoxal phosphate-dependent protein
MNYQDLPTPALVIDLDIVERNLDRMAVSCRENGVGLRPHTKTHKIVEVAKMQLDRGALGLTVAKVGEAEALSPVGNYELLVAHPILGREKLRRLAELSHSQPILVALDSLYAAEELSKAAVSNGASFGVLIEFDAGVHRCGLPPGPALVKLARAIEKLPSIRCRGLMTYFGNVWGTPAERAMQAPAVVLLVEEAIDVFTSAKLPMDIVSGGSTPSAHMPGLLSLLTEIRPGTYVYNDLNTYYQDLCTLDDCAVRIVTTVVSDAVPGRAMIDAGSKTLSTDLLGSGPKRGFGYISEHPHLRLDKLDEEHGYLTNVADATPSVGDVVTIIPNHVCTTINMHDEANIVRNGQVIGTWRIAGRGKVC